MPICLVVVTGRLLHNPSLSLSLPLSVSLRLSMPPNLVPRFLCSTRCLRACCVRGRPTCDTISCWCSYLQPQQTE
uniref:Putative secreted protein n=1 Tax=Anopheles triannulatus TaxID=58253 RepID=A0A2M4B5E2_9DIPT